MRVGMGSCSPAGLERRLVERSLPRRLVFACARAVAPESSSGAGDGPRKRRGRVYSAPSRRELHELLIPALKQHRAKHGHGAPSRAHVELVMDAQKGAMVSYQLGQSCTRLRRAGREQLGQADARSLDAVGFVWDVQKFQFFYKTLPALRYFKAQNGHVNVGRAYVVPDEDNVPTIFRGYSLGKAVGELRKLRDELPDAWRSRLETLEFVWDLKHHYFTNTIVPALEYFKQIHGHANVPQSWTVPADRLNVPSALQNVPLGSIISHIRHRGDYIDGFPKRRVLLEDMGISLTTWSVKQRFDEEFTPALVWFKERHGHMLVPQNTRLPEANEEGGDSVPNGLHGYNLGQRARDWKKFVDARPERYEVLEELGFVHSLRDEKFFHGTLPALSYYAEKAGDLNVPYDYCISKNEDVPPGLRGFPLGAVLYDLRYRERIGNLPQNRIDALDAFNAGWRQVMEGPYLRYRNFVDNRLFVLVSLNNFYARGETVDATCDRTIVDLVRLYKKIHGHAYIPDDGVSDRTHILNKFLGYPLGRLTQKIKRSTQTLPDSLLWSLESVGFRLTKEQHTFHDKVIIGLVLYLRMHKNLHILRSYRLPSTDEIPQYLHGYRLGQVVNSIRKEGKHIKNDSERIQKLRDLGFFELELTTMNKRGGRRRVSEKVLPYLTDIVRDDWA